MAGVVILGLVPLIFAIIWRVRKYSRPSSIYLSFFLSYLAYPFLFDFLIAPIMGAMGLDSSPDSSIFLWANLFLLSLPHVGIGLWALAKSRDIFGVISLGALVLLHLLWTASFFMKI